MGQQQLLLIILGVIIVALSVSAGIAFYNDHLLSVNRDAVQNDLTEISTQARKYFFLSHHMGGGGHSFVGLTADAAGMLKIASPEFSNNENGTYSIQTAGDASLVILQGIGKVQLRDGSYPMYYCRVRERKILMQQIN